MTRLFSTSRRDRCRKCQSEASSLSRCVRDDPFVRTQNLPVFIYKITARVFFAGSLLQEGNIISVRHKADVLALTLFCIDHAGFAGLLTDFAFLQIAKREHCVRQLFLR